MFYMQDYQLDENEKLRKVLANNLIKYRKANNLTQMEVAQKLAYSDKNISRWERGELVPDITNLKKLSQLYNISVDDFLSENNQPTKSTMKIKYQKKRFFTRKQLLISLLSISIVWLTAFIAFFILNILNLNSFLAWKVFVIAIPLSMIVLLVFSSLWCTNLFNCIVVSFLIWSVALAFYITFTFENSWLIFILAIPLQVMDILWFVFRKVKKVVSTSLKEESKEKES